MTNEMKNSLLQALAKLHARHELSETIGPDYFEPGMMEYLDKSEGLYDALSGDVLLRFEAKGTRYDGRTEQIEKLASGDSIQVVREKDNLFNPNNFTLLTKNGQNVGNMPAELCNVIAPLFDEGSIVFEGASVSYVEPISKRNRHAKQAILFVELRGKLADCAEAPQETAFDENLPKIKPVGLEDIWDKGGIVPISIADHKPLLDRIENNIAEVFMAFDQAVSPHGVIKTIFDLGVGVYNYQDFDLYDFKGLDPFSLNLKECFAWLTTVQRNHYWDGGLTNEYDILFIALKNRICQLLWDKLTPELKRMVEKTHALAESKPKDGKVRIFHANGEAVSEQRRTVSTIREVQGMMTRITFTDGETIDGFITECSKLPLGDHPFGDSVEVYNWRGTYSFHADEGTEKENCPDAFNHCIIPTRDIVGIDAMTYTHPRWGVYVDEFGFVSSIPKKEAAAKPHEKADGELDDKVVLKAHEIAPDFYLIECNKSDASRITERFGKEAKANTLQFASGKLSFYGLNTVTKSLIPLRYLTVFFGGHEGLSVGPEQKLLVSLDEYHLVEWDFADWFKLV